MQEEKTLMDSLYRLMRNLRRRPAGRVHPSRNHIRTLKILLKEDRQSSGQLSEALDIRPSSLSELLNRMEKEGVIIRQKDSQDMRITRVCLTDKGREALDSHKKSRWEDEKRLEEWLSEEEKEIFQRICDKLSLRLEEARDEEL